jgi:uncharacterized protein (TIGR03435 family)
MRLPILGVFAFTATCSALAQSNLTFEVASVRQSDFQSNAAVKPMTGGPGTDDPGRMTWWRRSLGDLLVYAYGLKPDRILGPDWITSGDYLIPRFDIVANVPNGATKEQVQVMLQNLLAERFSLSLHHEQKNFPAYELTVAKAGPKLKASSIDPNNLAPPPKSHVQTLRDGIVPELPEGFAGMASTPPGPSGVWHTIARAQFVSALVGLLKSVTGEDVVDKTGLTGVYDFNLEYTTEGLTGNFADIAVLLAQKAAALQARNGQGTGEVQSPDGPNLFSALEKQLGLKLAKKSEPVDVLVIDHAEKVPAVN